MEREEEETAKENPTVNSKNAINETCRERKTFSLEREARYFQKITLGGKKI